jgi:uncharacterized protein YlxP (DUF503 family)
MFVGVCRLVLRAAHCHSLKEKRSVVRRIKDRTRSRFNLALTEVGGQDTWQRVVLGFAVVGNERAYVDSTVEKVVRFIEGMAVAEIAAEERETLHYGDAPIGDRRARDERDDGWIPDDWVDGRDRGDGVA